MKNNLSSQQADHHHYCISTTDGNTSDSKIVHQKRGGTRALRQSSRFTIQITGMRPETLHLRMISPDIDFVNV